MQKHVTLIQMLISHRTYYVLDFHSQVQQDHFKNVDQCENPSMSYAIFLLSSFFIQRFLFHISIKFGRIIFMGKLFLISAAKWDISFMWIFNDFKLTDFYVRDVKP